MPANQPPNADVNRVAVPIKPASALLIANTAMIAGMAKLKICTSSASSAQPPKQAQNVRFSFGCSSPYQATGLVSLAVASFVIAMVSPPLSGAFPRALSRTLSWHFRTPAIDVLGRKGGAPWRQSLTEIGTSGSTAAAPSPT